MTSFFIISLILVLTVTNRGEKLIQKSNQTDNNILNKKNDSSLLKAMEGGTLNGTFENVVNDNHETKGKIIPRKGVIPDNHTKNESIIEEKPKISPRKGVDHFESINIAQSNNTHQNISTTTTTTTTTSTTTTTTTTTTQKPTVKKKPLFTMIKDESSKDADSFIESPTTGRDYVLPIVLFILLCPAILFIIKLIYKRGTEFTERQQYHRMYLIDGMYNTR